METMQAATNQFQTAYNSARRTAFFDAIRRRSSDLPTLDEVCGDLSHYRRVAHGVKSIPLAAIVGSEGRAHEFDAQFLPRATYLKERWTRVADAMRQGLRLPPIQVYKLGERYFVCDGNHRVSVARHNGQDTIAANVTELVADTLMA